METERIYSAEQISVPACLPSIIKNWTKAVIRANPEDIVAFSAQYFGNITNSKASEKPQAESVDGM